MPIQDDGDVQAATSEVIDAHRRAGYLFDVDGVGSFVREEGSGPAVVLLHGVPSSSFLYRKVLPLLSAEGLRGVAFDFPGLGLAERPGDYDYSWSGLARFTGEVLDALGIERCHLVVHDIGGPLQGVRDRSATPREEVYAYVDLLKREDAGQAFLRIMRGFERTEEKQRLLWDGLAPGRRAFPAQVVWGAGDPALGEKRRLAVQRVLGIDDPILLPAKHFLQEDQAAAIAGAIAALAKRDYARGS